MFQHAVFDFLGDYYVAVPINAQRTEARYLANLFVGLEGKGIVDRVLLPPAFVVRRKLKLQGSAFAGEKAYRLYRFRSGAWSKLVLDAILGTGPRRDAPGPAIEETAQAAARANGRTAPDFEASQSPLTPALSPKGRGSRPGRRRCPRSPERATRGTATARSPRASRRRANQSPMMRIRPRRPSLSPMGALRRRLKEHGVRN